MAGQAALGAVRAEAHRIPSEAPEADGTFAWTSTTMALVEVEAGGRTGLGCSYDDAGAAVLAAGTLAAATRGRDPMRHPGVLGGHAAGGAQHGTVRGRRTCRVRRGRGAADLKAKLLGLPLAALMRRLPEAVPIYSSGGFATYSGGQMQDQSQGWVQRDGCRAVKIKVGTCPEQDPPAWRSPGAGSATARSCSWTRRRADGQAGHRLRRSARRSGHDLVRGAGLVR